MLPGIPERIAWKTYSSSVPNSHRVVRSGPLKPFASAPWHSAQRFANSAAPARIAAGSPSKGFPPCACAC